MIYEGMIDEAYAITKGARDRYDGVPRPPIGRNPWNEIECGGHYARAMSSWSLLTGVSGYEYDGATKSMRFTPRVTPERFKSFFAGPEGWGSLVQTREGGKQRNEIRVVEGVAVVGSILLAPPAGSHELTIIRARKVNGQTVVTTIEATPKSQPDGVLVEFGQPIPIGPDESLSFNFSPS